MRGLLVPLLVLAFLLSGCTQVVDEATPEGTDGGTGPAAEAPREPLRLPLPSMYERTLWMNGTFAAADSCNTGGCATGKYQQTMTLTEYVPKGVPVQLDVALDFPADVVFYGNLHVQLVADERGFHSFDERMAPGEQRLTVVMQNEGAPLMLVVNNYFPRSGAADVSYTLRVDITAWNETVPAGVPAAVTIPAGAWLRLHTTEEVAVVQVYGPDDALVGAFAPQDGLVDWQAQAPGEHVLVAGPSGAMRATTNATDVQLRTLLLTRTYSEPMLPAADKPTQWTFAVEARALRVGLYWQATDIHGTWLHTADEAYSLGGPAGPVFEGAFRCMVCLSATPDARIHFHESAPGDPKVVAGSYTGRYDWQGSWGILVGDYTVTYAR